MSDDKKPNNVIQFPGRRKEAEPSVEAPVASSSPIPSSPDKIALGKPPVSAPKKKKSKKTMAGTVLAILLATGAVNKYVFESKVQSLEFVSDSRGADRGPASAARSALELFPVQRDAQWEKETAERLASPGLRAIASTNIGRSATLEENLRWGTLEEAKYTIAYKPDTKQIHSILLQGEATEPSYILDRAKFLKEYGRLFEAEFRTASLKSVETINEKTVESYTLFNEKQQATAEIRFELDRHKRLISLKVEPSNI